MKQAIGIVDLFSGPGGLGEGFSEVRDLEGRPVFEIDLSVEKDPIAHATLRLRAFLRKFGEGVPKEYVEFLNRDGDSEPDWATLYPSQWKAAGEEALNLTLGAEGAMETMAKRLATIRKQRGDRLVLIGGPPCQAYSLAGRSRKPSSLGYVPHVENRHRLYEEYIKVLRALRPAAFVMENVKGMLSSSIENRKVFELVTSDLIAGGGAAEYILVPLSGSGCNDSPVPPRAFVVQAEHHGVPQARHRVILVGIRRDLLDGSPDVILPFLRPVNREATVRDVLECMPVLRSGISARGGNRDEIGVWKKTVSSAALSLLDEPVSLIGEQRRLFQDALGKLASTKRVVARHRKVGSSRTEFLGGCPSELAEWLHDSRLVGFVQNETRGHMKSDLARYLFAASWTLATGVSPKAKDFPDILAPAHASWKSGKFNDRFRAQPWDRPASTVTCHISKDGHYFIHPDPGQCRSMTVREAARLQTFPDNYFFKGNRTQQYIQVGNAVPPFLAWKIGATLADTLSGIFSEIDGQAAKLASKEQVVKATISA